MESIKLEFEFNSHRPDQLQKITQLVREGWEIGRIEPATGDTANNDFKIILIRF